ncbi:retrovirus-related pol polyprotein from transposon TNT 1-94 [Tanacetum coccineum]
MQHSYKNSQHQQQVSPYQSSHYGTPLKSQQYSVNQSSVHHNVYSPSSSIPQLEYAPSVNQQLEFSQQDSGLIVLVFQRGDDPIDTINHVMSFLTAVGRQTSYAAGTTRTYTPGASRSNLGKQRTAICYNCKGEGHMSKQCTKPKRKRDYSWFKEKVLLVQAQAHGQILNEEELAFLADPRIAEAINGFDVPLPVAVCSGIVNSLFKNMLSTDLISLYQELFDLGLANSSPMKQVLMPVKHGELMTICCVVLTPTLKDPPHLHQSLQTQLNSSICTSNFFLKRILLLNKANELTNPASVTKGLYPE